MGYMGTKFKKLDFADLDEPFGPNNYSIIASTITVDESFNTKPDTQYFLMIYYDKSVPDTLTQDSTPELDEAYHELLTVKLLERIASARKDTKMKNNFNADANEIMGDFLMESPDEEPDYPSCRDDLPRRYRCGTMDD